MAELSEWGSPDKTILKKIMKTGTGLNSPNIGSHCRIVIREITSNIIDLDPALSIIEGQEMDYIINQYDSTFTDFIDKSLESMKQGEMAEVKLNKHVENGFADSEDVTMPKPTIFSLELINFERATEYYEMTKEEKLSLARNLKEKGTSLYTQNRINRAFNRFSSAYKHIIGMGKHAEIEADLRDEYNQIKCACCLNMAACFIKAKNWNHVVTHCTNGLKVSPDHVKGLYRRAQAYHSLGKTHEAREDLNKAQELEPNNTAVKELLKQVIDKEKKEDEGLAKAMKKAFTCT